MFAMKLCCTVSQHNAQLSAVIMKSLCCLKKSFKINKMACHAYCCDSMQCQNYNVEQVEKTQK